MPRILIADSEILIRQVLRRLIHRWYPNAEIETYASAPVLLDRCAAGQPDCLIVDLGLSGLAEPATRERLSALAVRVPMLTLLIHPSEGPCARRLGSSAVVDKPFDVNVLRAALARALRMG